MLELMDQILRDEEEWGAFFLISFYIDRPTLEERTAKEHEERGLSLEFDKILGLHLHYTELVHEYLGDGENSDPNLYVPFGDALHEKYLTVHDLIRDLFERGYIEQAMRSSQVLKELAG
jgi:hypothetical protein